MLICVLVVFCLCITVQGNIYNPNSTDLTKCKVHYSRSGSAYKDFYALHEEPGQNESLLLDFHFAVLALSDAHILLAPSESVKVGDPAYELVIGAGGNTFCDIRRKQKSDVKASQRVRGLLSALDPSFFWLHVTKDGVIELGREGEELAFISWLDPDPLPVKVISFSTWSGIEAKWYFDCERQNETEKIEKPLTKTEQLRRDLLFYYNPYVRPVMDHNTLTTVIIALKISHIDLDEYKSCIEVIAPSKMAWHDEKLIWDPSDYDDIDVIHIFRREIWQPDIKLFHNIDTDRDIVQDSMMLVHSTGLVEWNPVLNLHSWCDVEELGMWPRDVHKCTLSLAMKKEFNHIDINFIKNESSFITNSLSNWMVLEADVMLGKFASDNWTPPVLTITLAIQRQSHFYNTIFFTPFFVISICVLMSFVADPFKNLKISLNCSQLVLATVVLLVLAVIAPNHSVHIPHLVSLYSYSMVAILVAMVISIIVINISRVQKKKPIPHILLIVLKSRVMEMGLCLPKVNLLEEYGNLNDVAAKSQEKDQLMWIQLGVVIDRLSFLLYLCLTIYTIYAFY